MSNTLPSISQPLQTSVAGMQRASKGMETAAQEIVGGGLSRLNDSNGGDRVTLSDQAQAMLRGEAPRGLEESAMDLKKHQIAYQASAAVAKMASERTDAFTELIARHQ